MVVKNIKTLNKNQKMLKNIRDVKRKEYLDKLEKLGKKKKDSSGNRSGYSAGSHLSSSIVQSSLLANNSQVSSSGTAITTTAYFNNQIYLKSTQIGLDGWLALGRYPWGNGAGTNEIHDQLLYFEIKYTTYTVTDEESFDYAWVNTSSYYSVGSSDNVTTVYSVPNYWHNTPILSSGNGYQQLYKFKFGNSDLTWYISGGGWSSRVLLTILTDPTISFSQSTNNFTVSNYASNTYRAIEFNRDSYTPYSAYLTSTETDICYNCSVRNYENGIYYGQTQQAFDFALWDAGTYTVKLNYASGHPSGTRTRFSNAVNNWIAEMNAAISGSGVSFTRNDSDSSPDILVETKSNADMGAPSGYIYGGLWYNETNTDGWIDYAWIRINYETNLYDGLFTSVEAIVLEELTQACGCGGDLTTRADCINTDFNWYGKSDGTFNTIDYNIQNFLYNSDIYLAVGTDSEDLAVRMNPSNGFISTSGTTASAYWMEEDVTYNMRVWQANSSNHYSVIPSYSQTFTPTDYPATPSSPSAGTPPRIAGGMNLTWSAADNADYYMLQYRNYAGSYYVSVDALSKQLTGLLYGVTYYLSLSARSDYNKPPSAYSSESQLTTAPKTPTLSFASATNTTISVSIGVSTGNWSFVKVWYRLRGSSDAWGSITITNPTTTGTISGLTTGSEYEIKASSFYTVSGTDLESVDSSGNISFSSLVYAKSIQRPSNWSWTTPIAAGTDVPSVSGKTIYIMPATEWNAFTTKINDFRDYKNLTDYTFTSVSTNTEITKAIVNEALTAIRDMGVTVPANRVTGDNILQASLYTDMRDALNSIA